MKDCEVCRDGVVVSGAFTTPCGKTCHEKCREGCDCGICEEARGEARWP